MLVQIRNLSRVYSGAADDVRAIEQLDLEISHGEFLAVVGVSGSGKSTLLHLLGGLDTPSSGSIRVNGKELGSLSAYERALYRRATVGFVFQAFHLVPSMSAEANVALALTLQGVYGAQRRDRAAEALRQVGLDHRRDHRPGELSGGEQQRVAIARAIVHRPPLLLADEPTGNLDRATAADVVALMNEIREKHGTTVVMVTHDEETARRVADRVIRLRDGRLDPELSGVPPVEPARAAAGPEQRSDRGMP